MGTERSGMGKNITWAFAERTLSQLIGFVITVILARLITPAQYGYISVISIFTSILSVFVTEGLSSSLIQKRDADNRDISTILVANFVLSLFLYAVIFLCAPLIAIVYHEPSLTSLTRVLAVQVIIGSVNSVQRANIAKQLQFKLFCLSTSAGRIISAIIGVLLAYHGFGAWALVAQTLAGTFSDTAILFIIKKPISKVEFSPERFKRLASFGWKVLLSQLLITVFTNIRNLIIGTRFSSEALAYTSKGEQIPGLLSNNINTSLSQVLFPVLSREQNDIRRVRERMRKVIRMSSYVLSPMLIGTAAIARPLTIVLFTDRWIGAIPYIQLFALIYLLQPMQTASIQAIKSIGRSDTYLVLEIFKKVINIAILAVSIFAFHSVEAIIIGSLIAEAISAIMNIPVNCSFFRYRLSHQLMDFSSSWLMSAAMAAAVYLVTLIPIGNIAKLAASIPVGVLTYYLISKITKNSSFAALKALVAQRMRRWANESRVSPIDRDSNAEQAAVRRPRGESDLSYRKKRADRCAGQQRR